MSEQINESTILKALGWAYEKALNPGVPGIDSAYDLANDYGKGDSKIEDKVNSLIRWQNTKSGTAGFVSGLGGIITLPVAVPANISTVLFVQIRMIAAIAIMGGYDVKSDKVQTLVYTCLLGNAAKEIFKQTGIHFGSRITLNAIKKISGAVIAKINSKVGFRLLTKFGEKGVINIGKAVPIVGGIIGATLDVVSTNISGNVARNIFITSDNKID